MSFRKLPWASFMTPEILLPFAACVAEKGPDECWLWQGCRKSGSFRYGLVDVGRGGRRVRVLAHRFMFAIEHGARESNRHEVIRHTCDTPACVNPAHLVGGTHADNTADRETRGRANHPRGEGHGMARLTEESVRAIRQRVADGESVSALSREFKVSRMAIYLIVKRRNWASVA